MLDSGLKSLAQQPNFAAVTTLLPGGQPMTQVVWVASRKSTGGPYQMPIGSDRVILVVEPDRVRVQS